MANSSPSPVQQRELAKLTSRVLVEIRRLADAGNAEQAAALADAFHSIPEAASSSELWSTELAESALLEYERRFPSRARFLASFHAIFREPGTEYCWDVPAFFSRHLAVEPPSLANARRGYNSGEWWVDYPSGTPTTESLLAIYTARAELLSTRHGEGAKKLLDDVQKFCSTLASHPNERAQFWSFNGPEGSVVVAVELLDKSVLLGCMASLDKRRAVSDSLLAFWGNDKP